MNIRTQACRWWDNLVSDWMEYEDEKPRRAAGISVALLLSWGIIVLAVWLHLCWPLWGWLIRAHLV